MNETLQRLIDVLPPPLARPEPPPWDRAVEEIGFQFPSDYRAFVDRYGGGAINEELHVSCPTEFPYEPGVSPGFAGYLEAMDLGVGDAYRSMRDSFPEDYPYPIFPEPGGLLQWGVTGGGDDLFWLTEDEDPDRWPVVIWWRNLDPRWESFPGGTVEFLLAVAERRHEYTEHLLWGTTGMRWHLEGDWKVRYPYSG
ncbi:SMI1/KNR4 family protein [Amycolatopsis thermoflava]|uniref:SUKH superfamily protein n=1 Tax=Amycolatopsis thermoflava TaxID=84480 RepID=A0A3N2GX42_9PSEU|nr:SMI1/KNR4 family protein [Amycolatopsis thermoflava]ROS41143.1 SUKH superfamily protein [Amycolatopsis thermoflava]